MYIHGEFLSRWGDVISVHIVTGGDRSTQVEIAPDSEVMQFPADSPVEIGSEVNDTFDVLLPQSATIRVLTRSFIPELFGASVTDAVVNIYRGDTCLFAGFVEPQSYSQGYNDMWDELEINCIDVLSALRYRKIDGGNWATAWQRLGGLSFRGLLNEALAPLLSVVNLLPAKGGAVSLWYDGSKGLQGGETPIQRSRVLDKIKVSPAIFLGGDAEDVATSQKVAEEILKYLNLHLRQDGLNFYLFDWATIKKGGSTSWGALPLSYGSQPGASNTAPTQARKPISSSAVAITTDIADDTNTRISVGEVYNKITLTANVEEVSELIKNPMQEGDLTATHPRELYLTEYHIGENDREEFLRAWHGGQSKSDRVTITEYYVQAMTHKDWVFSTGGANASSHSDPNMAGVSDWWEVYRRATEGTGDLTSHYEFTKFAGWAAVPNMLSRSISAAILNIGKIEKKADLKDNSLVARLDSDPVLIIGVNGNGFDTDLDKARPSVEEIKSAIPVARYSGKVGAVLSPADEVTTNYIVISGKITLNARNYMAGGMARRRYERPATNPSAGGVASYVAGWMDGVDESKGEEWVPGYNPYYRYKGDYLRFLGGFSPHTGKGEKLLEFKYSAIGDSTDKVSKIGVLACMLIVGDKCVVETGTQGQVSDFTWVKYKPLAQCANEDEYYQQCFTIGFNPKIGDYLVGQEYDIQNNIHYSMNIDAEGMAIPIRESDRVSGEVRFIILGPVNTVFDDITRRHPTFFRRTKWGATSKLLLPHVANIQVKNFEIKVASDSGGLTTDNDADIVYSSAVSNAFDNPHDDIEFAVTTALTHDECKRLGILNKVNLSSPISADTGAPIRWIYDANRGLVAKAEQLYVDAYYREYSRPRVTMEQTLQDRDNNVGLFHHYIHPAMGRTFYVLGLSRDLIEGTARLTIKEIDK